MYVIKRSAADNLWTVGYYELDNGWCPLRDFNEEEACFRFINYLNGGTGKYRAPK